MALWKVQWQLVAVSVDATAEAEMKAICDVEGAVAVAVIAIATAEAEMAEIGGVEGAKAVAVAVSAAATAEAEVTTICVVGDAEAALGGGRQCCCYCKRGDDINWCCGRCRGSGSGSA